MLCKMLCSRAELVRGRPAARLASATPRVLPQARGSSSARGAADSPSLRLRNGDNAATGHLLPDKLTDFLSRSHSINL